MVNKSLADDRQAKGLPRDKFGFFRVDEIRCGDCPNSPETLEVVIVYIAEDKKEYSIIRTGAPLESWNGYSGENAYLNALSLLYKLLTHGTGDCDYSKFVDGTFNCAQTVD